MLYLGTGGFSNEDWVGIFYPPELKQKQWLEFYAQHFNSVEINSTFYAVPGQKTFISMLERSQGKIKFTAKLHQSFTHAARNKSSISESAMKNEAAKFCYSLEPLRQANCLGPLLAQFPFSFKNLQESRTHIAHLAEWFTPHTLAVEFRHASWQEAGLYQYLHDLNILPVSVDYPPLPNLPGPTLHTANNTLYLRLHGRNTEKWFDAKDAAERHDYLYTPEELLPWVRAIHKIPKLEAAYVFFENTTRGQGLENAKQFKELWKKQ